MIWSSEPQRHPLVRHHDEAVNVSLRPFYQKLPSPLASFALRHDWFEYARLLRSATKAARLENSQFGNETVLKTTATSGDRIANPGAAAMFRMVVLILL